MRWITGEGLLAAEQRFRPCLRRVTIDVSGLILEMEQEPQLDARIRHRKLDAMRPGECCGAGQVVVRVDVVEAPDLVVRSVSAATGIVILRVGVPPRRRAVLNAAYPR